MMFTLDPLESLYLKDAATKSQIFSYNMFKEIRKICGFSHTFIRPLCLDITIERMLTGYEILDDIRYLNPLVLCSFDVTHPPFHRYARIDISVTKNDPRIINIVRNTVRTLDPEKKIIREVKERMEEYFDEEFVRSIRWPSRAWAFNKITGYGYPLST